MQVSRNAVKRPENLALGILSNDNICFKYALVPLSKHSVRL